MPVETFPTFDRPSNISVVNGCQLLQSLSTKDRGTVAMHSFMAYAERDETIWTEGSPSEFIAIIGTGSVRLTRSSRTGQEYNIQMVEYGQAFGLEAVCGGSSHQSNAIAAEHTWYLKVPAAVVISLMCDKVPGRETGKMRYRF